MRVLGLDVGEKRIGIALSDPGKILASPLAIIDGTDIEAAIQAISGIIKSEGVERIIVGLPRSMNGAIGQQAEKVAVFTEQLRNHVTLPVEFRDERLTSVSARRLIREAKPKAGRRKQTPDDAVAAAIILQSYLDELMPT